MSSKTGGVMWLVAGLMAVFAGVLPAFHGNRLGLGVIGAGLFCFAMGVRELSKGAGRAPEQR